MTRVLSTQHIQELYEDLNNQILLGTKYLKKDNNKNKIKILSKNPLVRPNKEVRKLPMSEAMPYSRCSEAHIHANEMAMKCTPIITNAYIRVISN